MRKFYRVDIVEHSCNLQLSGSRCDANGVLVDLNKLYPYGAQEWTVNFDKQDR